MLRGLEVLCGLSLDGARLTEVEELAVGQARVGCAVFGPTGLLRDLELRLGLAHVGAPHAVRIARWSARLAALAPRGRFYSRSYEVDSWGTASELAMTEAAFLYMVVIFPLLALLAGMGFDATGTWWRQYR